MNKRWLCYGLIAAFAAVFVLFWVQLGDRVGAFLSLIVLALAVGLIVAVVGYFTSNIPAWLRRLRGVTHEEYLKQLETTGEAIREHYQTYRALTFEELNTSSVVHFIDVGAGQVLCLYGQQYFDFEPIDDDPDVNQPRKFPTKEFDLLRHKNRNEVLEVFPGPAVVEPTICKPIAGPKKLHDLGITFEDGQLVSGVAFDALKDAVQRAAFKN
jgi:hypothetical protein